MAWVAPRRRVTPTPAVPSPVEFVDVTGRAGVAFKHNNGAFGLKWMPETMSSGVAFLDYDSDGDQDLFLVNGRYWNEAEVGAYRDNAGREHAQKYGVAIPKRLPQRRTPSALYRNNRDGTFTDVTAQSGLNVEMYGMGAAVGDYDNDGRVDLFVAGYGQDFLFHNEGRRGQARFREVAGALGVRGGGFGTSAAWVDYDKDGRLDLYVCRYIEWTPATDQFYSTDQNNRGKSYAGPLFYHGQASRLYRNVGARFEDVTARAGIDTPVNKGRRPGQKLLPSKRQKIHPRSGAVIPDPERTRGKAMGVLICDFNQDGWPDIVSANDEVPTYLFRNNKNGTFTEVGLRTGIALSAEGRARGGMGIDGGDIDGSGRESVAIGFYSDEMIGLYQNAGGFYRDIAQGAGVGAPSLSFVVFGLTLSDMDNDGRLDLLAANGHVQDDVKRMRRDLFYKQRPLFYINQSRPAAVQFAEVGLQSGEAMSRPIVGRGLACADWDLDGDTDVVLTTNGGPAYLLLNNAKHNNRAVRLVLRGTDSNRDAIGARVVARVGSQTLLRTVRSGSSYLSQSELPLTLGLGRAQRIDQLQITWPLGRITRLRDLQAGYSYIVREDGTSVQRQPLSRGTREK